MIERGELKRFREFMEALHVAADPSAVTGTEPEPFGGDPMCIFCHTTTLGQLALEDHAKDCEHRLARTLLNLLERFG